MYVVPGVQLESATKTGKNSLIVGLVLNIMFKVFSISEIMINHIWQLRFYYYGGGKKRV